MSDKAAGSARPVAERCFPRPRLNNTVNAGRIDNVKRPDRVRLNFSPLTSHLSLLTV